MHLFNHGMLYFDLQIHTNENRLMKMNHQSEINQPRHVQQETVIKKEISGHQTVLVEKSSSVVQQVCFTYYLNVLTLVANNLY